MDGDGQQHPGDFLRMIDFLPESGRVVGARGANRARLMLRGYFKKVYERTMGEAYGLASREIVRALENGGDCLDCGAVGGHWFDKLSDLVGMDKSRYYGVEWNTDLVVTKPSTSGGGPG
jgi:hypothetical protein